MCIQIGYHPIRVINVLQRWDDQGIFQPQRSLFRTCNDRFIFIFKVIVSSWNSKRFYFIFYVFGNNRINTIILLQYSNRTNDSNYIRNNLFYNIWIKENCKRIKSYFLITLYLIGIVKFKGKLTIILYPKSL